MTTEPITVLIVDDNANMRGILAAILKSAGVRRILEAGDGVDKQIGARTPSPARA